MSIRLRFALWSTVTLGVVLLLFAAAVLSVVRTILIERATTQIGGSIDRIAAIAIEEPDDHEEFFEELLEAVDAPIFAAVVDGVGWCASEGWERAELPSPNQASDSIISTAMGSYRVSVRPGTHDGHVAWFAAAVDNRVVQDNLRGLAWVLVALLPCGFGLAIVSGFWLAGRLLAPARSLAAGAEKITAARLHERLPVMNPGDEFGRLATAFNQVLSRLEESFERLRRFTADASHELRTPLTAMKTVGEVALRADGTVHQSRDAIGSMLEEVDRLTGLVDRLLTLTRADAGAYRARFQEFDLSELVREVTDWLRPVAEERGVDLHFVEPETLPVWGDVTTLREAVVNLVDNALNHTPAGGKVDVECGLTATSCFVEVRDTGPGIAVEHHPHLFERFYHIQPTTGAIGTPHSRRGAGLGLAIAKWGVELHRGTIALKSALGKGSTFRILLPRAASDVSPTGL